MWKGVRDVYIHQHSTYPLLNMDTRWGICLPGTGDLYICSQTYLNTFWILLFLDNLLRFYQTISMTLPFRLCDRFGNKGMCATITVALLLGIAR